MKRITQTELINSLNVQLGDNISFLLGAGCSIQSGCMGANKLVNEFKRRIFCSTEGIAYSENLFLSDTGLDKKICEFFSNDNLVCNHYSYYFEKCFPNPNDRNIFIHEKFKNIKPSYGYLCFADYIISKKIKNILTTNFDSLIEKSIRTINPNYDIIKTSDNLAPIMNFGTNVIELHGDFNYDQLRNTDEELEVLSDSLLKQLQSINIKKLIVMGYSGQDKSVMSFLENYASLNRDFEIIWCVVEPDFDDKNVVGLLTKNINSSLCLIKGFDDLFEKLYKVSGGKNEIINAFIKSKKESDFLLFEYNQPEEIEVNCLPIITLPNIIEVEKNINYEILKNINTSNNNLHLEQYNKKIYAIGDKEILRNLLSLNDEIINIVSLNDLMLPINIKKKFIKEFIKKNRLKHGVCVFKDNLYIENKNQKIQEGLKISIEIINDIYCLCCSFNYFIPHQVIFDNDKSSINTKKSSLYANKNYLNLKTLINDIFQNESCLYFFDEFIKINYDMLNVITGNQKHIKYNCSSEPLLSINKKFSVNQIKLLNEYGPQTNLYSLNKIKVGVFCVKEDRDKLNKYLNKLLHGTNYHSKNNSVIPMYKGFSEVFKKDIEISWDALPEFSITQIEKTINHIDKTKKRTLDKIIYDAISKYYDNKSLDIMLIYIGDNLKAYKSYNGIDLHDKVKLNCLNKYKTQFLEGETLESKDDINKIIFNLGMGIYTKTIGIPWVPKEYEKDVLFVGIGFGVDSNGVTVGCSQLFDSAGRGMQLIVSKISDKHRKNQYLTNDEAYDLGRKIRATYYNSTHISEIKKIVIHRLGPYKDDEIDGFKKAFVGIDDFELIEIIDNTNFNAFKLKNGKIQGFPVKRGTIIQISKKLSFVWLDGTIVNEHDVLNGMNYRNNTRGMGKPIGIRKYHGQQDVNSVVNDLMFLTKMDFNSSDVIYSKLPVTIKYAKVVCDILKQGSFEDELIDFEYIM